MNAFQFTTLNVLEVRQRLSHINASSDAVNFGKTEPQVIQQFLDDQLHRTDQKNTQVHKTDLAGSQILDFSFVYMPDLQNVADGIAVTAPKSPPVTAVVPGR